MFYEHKVCHPGQSPLVSILLIEERVGICSQHGRLEAQGMEPIHNDIISTQSSHKVLQEQGAPFRVNSPPPTWFTLYIPMALFPICAQSFLSHQVQWNQLAVLIQSDICSSKSTAGVAFGPASSVFTFPLEVRSCLLLTPPSIHPSLRIGELPILFPAGVSR